MGRDRLFAAVGVAVMLLSALAPTGLAASAAAQADGDLEVGVEQADDYNATLTVTGDDGGNNSNGNGGPS